MSLLDGLLGPRTVSIDITFLVRQALAAQTAEPQRPSAPDGSDPADRVQDAWDQPGWVQGVAPTVIGASTIAAPAASVPAAFGSPVPTPREAG